MIKKNIWLFGAIIFTLLFLSSAVAFRILDIEILPSQFYGALISVVITAIITVLLLKGQSAQEAERDKDVKIFEEKIRVYSEFTDKMWAMFDDDLITAKELKDLRAICFQKLVFYLDKDLMHEISDHIESISLENIDFSKIAVAEITLLLKDNLHSVETDRKGDLIRLFNVFSKENSEVDDKDIIENEIEEYDKEELSKSTSPLKDTGYWHFNILNEKHQLQAFKDGNWVLALIEYGENWRTNLYSVNGERHWEEK